MNEKLRKITEKYSKKRPAADLDGDDTEIARGGTRYYKKRKQGKRKAKGKGKTMTIKINNGKNSAKKRRVEFISNSDSTSTTSTNGDADGTTSDANTSNGHTTTSTRLLNNRELIDALVKAGDTGMADTIRHSIKYEGFLGADLRKLACDLASDVAVHRQGE